MNKLALGGAAALLMVGGLIVAVGRARAYAAARNLVRGRATIDDRIRQYGPAAESRLNERVGRAGVAYPPTAAILVVLKQEKELRILVPEGGGWRQAATYPILAASGGPGPKLRRGDGQVPEGFYRIESLNPNSLYHLALRLDYPNAEDRATAAPEGRTDLGGDIMIHGKAASIGCLAVGDEASEELFVLAHRIGLEHIEVVLAPGARPDADGASPPWIGALYARLASRLKLLGIGP
jgi:hypothetical protein